MEEVFSGSKTKGTPVDLEPRPMDDLEKRHELNVIVSFLMILLVLFLVMGWINFRSGKAFNIPKEITFQGTLYQTEGEIEDEQGLVKTDKKVNNLAIYIEKVKPGQTYSVPVHQVYVKAGGEYVVYVLKRSK